jgi:hypothetical protein
MNIFKKIKLFYSYKNIILKNKSPLKEKFNIRIDKASRLYTVLNLNKEDLGQNFILKKTDRETLAKPFIDDYIRKISLELNSLGLLELYNLYTLEKVDMYSYLIVIGFSLFRSDTYYKILYGTIIVLIILSTLIYIKI